MHLTSRVHPLNAAVFCAVHAPLGQTALPHAPMTTPLPDNLQQRLDQLASQYDELGDQLLDPDVLADHRQVRQLSIRRKAIEPIVEAYRSYRSNLGQIAEMQSLIEAGDDAELIAIARAELPDLQQQADAQVDEIQRLLVHSDDASISSVMVELRAGVGGAEAAIWAGDLAQMYQHYARDRGWTVEQIDASPGEMGGFKQIILRIEGEGVWTALSHESGTHQVKRVPETEAQGRVHTSTATVAVLPEPEEVELHFDRSDVREMITTAQGPGGQNVNKVATAVHLIHEPTGIEVRMQDTKSQAQNREKAWALLKARLYERQLAEAAAERAEQRSAMIGTANRAEKIRTYRYKENLVVDHRAGSGSGGGSYNLSDVMAGRLQPMVDALIELETAQRLAAL